jgi:class 3 adenylate cyclase
VKHTGDGIISSFDDVPSALQCSMAIQAGFAARAADAPNPELRVRIGIAAGETVDHNDDLFGSTVTLASRICGAADAGRILTSDLVREGSERGFRFDEGRDVVLKGSPVLRAFRTRVAGALTRPPHRTPARRPLAGRGPAILRECGGGPHAPGTAGTNF